MKLENYGRRECLFCKQMFVAKDRAQCFCSSECRKEFNKQACKEWRTVRFGKPLPRKKVIIARWLDSLKHGIRTLHKKDQLKIEALKQEIQTLKKPVSESPAQVPAFDGIHCIVCGDEITAERMRLYPSTQTCSNACSERVRRKHQCNGWIDKKGKKHPCKTITSDYRCPKCWEKMGRVGDETSFADEEYNVNF